MPKYKVVMEYKNELYVVWVEAKNEEQAKQLAFIKSSHTIHDVNKVKINKIEKKAPKT